MGLMNQNTITAVISIGSALLGAVIGGWIAGRYSLIATGRAHEYERSLRDEEEARKLNGVLQAISAELSVLWRVYMTEVGSSLEKLDDGRALFAVIPLTQDYFTIFNANAAYIGAIPDRDLMRLLVLAYTRAQGVLDSIRFHNDNNELYKQVNRDFQAGKVTQQQLAKQHQAMIDYTNVLKENHAEVRPLIEETLIRLETWCRGNEPKLDRQ